LHAGDGAREYRPTRDLAQAVLRSAGDTDRGDADRTGAPGTDGCPRLLIGRIVVSPRGTADADLTVELETHARVALNHLIESEDLTMKDVLFIVVTAAFFAVAWVYAKSFDQL